MVKLVFLLLAAEMLIHVHHVDQKNAISTLLMVESYGFARVYPFKIELLRTFQVRLIKNYWILQRDF